MTLEDLGMYHTSLANTRSLFSQNKLKIAPKMTSRLVDHSKACLQTRMNSQGSHSTVCSHIFELPSRHTHTETDTDTDTPLF